MRFLRYRSVEVITALAVGVVTLALAVRVYLWGIASSSDVVLFLLGLGSVVILVLGAAFGWVLWRGSRRSLRRARGSMSTVENLDGTRRSSAP